MDGSMRLFDLEARTSQALQTPHSGAITGLVALSGARILSAGRGGVRLWELEADDVAASLPLPGFVLRCLRVTDDLVAVSDGEGHVHMVEASNGSVLRTRGG